LDVASGPEKKEKPDIPVTNEASKDRTDAKPVNEELLTINYSQAMSKPEPAFEMERDADSRYACKNQ
jgi:hypothetical protein